MAAAGPDSPLMGTTSLWLPSLLFPSLLSYLVPLKTHDFISDTVETKGIGDKNKIERQEMLVTKGTWEAGVW